MEDKVNVAPMVAELTTSFREMLKSEWRLARAESKEIASRVGRDSGLMTGFAVFSAFGIFPVMAFFVIGLGRLLNGNYWLSSLIVGCVMIGVGGALALNFYKKLKSVDIGMPHFRDSVERQFRTIDKKIHEISELASRRRQKL